MKSWSDSFERRADERRRQSKQPMGFYMTEDGPVPLNKHPGYVSALLRGFV